MAMSSRSEERKTIRYEMFIWLEDQTLSFSEKLMQILVVKQIDMAKASKKDQKDAANKAQILKNLRHRYVVKYFDSFLEDGKLNIIMEYCSGGSVFFNKVILALSLS